MLLVLACLMIDLSFLYPTKKKSFLYMMDEFFDNNLGIRAILNIFALFLMI